LLCWPEGCFSKRSASLAGSLAGSLAAAADAAADADAEIFKVAFRTGSHPHPHSTTTVAAAATTAVTTPVEFWYLFFFFLFQPSVVASRARGLVFFFYAGDFAGRLARARRDSRRIQYFSLAAAAAAAVVGNHKVAASAAEIRDSSGRTVGDLARVGTDGLSGCDAAPTSASQSPPSPVGLLRSRGMLCLPRGCFAHVAALPQRVAVLAVGLLLPGGLLC
jgi:hypothetical protein